MSDGLPPSDDELPPPTGPLEGLIFGFRYVMLGVLKFWEAARLQFNPDHFAVTYDAETSSVVVSSTGGGGGGIGGGVLFNGYSYDIQTVSPGESIALNPEIDIGTNSPYDEENRDVNLPPVGKYLVQYVIVAKYVEADGPAVFGVSLSSIPGTSGGFSDRTMVSTSGSVDGAFVRLPNSCIVESGDASHLSLRQVSGPTVQLGDGSNNTVTMVITRVG